MFKMEITISVPDKLAARARAQGVSLEVYIQQILAKETREVEDRVQAIRAATDRIFELRKQNKLGGTRIKDLIREGHRY